MDNKNKKILIICPFASPNIGGVETHLDKLIKEATDKNYRITLITYQPLTTRTVWEKHAKRKNFEVYRIKWFGIGYFHKLETFFPISFLYLFPGIFVKSLKYYLQNHNKVDCIHAHGFAAGTVARILKFIHKKRIVLSTHAIYHLGNRVLLSFLLKQVLMGFDFILGVSDLSLKEISETGFPKNKMAVHKNWVDTELFLPREKSKTKGIIDHGHSINVLFVGRLIEPKGIAILIEASKKLKNVNFHFVGAGPFEEELKKLSKDAENVYYYGVLRQSNKKEFETLLNLYSGCDYLISPYLYDEGFSATLIESICCGTPVIISNRGSPPTFLDESVAEFLSFSPDSDELVGLLKKLSSRRYDTA
jgi:glycosyltransferase involved in cell wall biosynthesis